MSKKSHSQSPSKAKRRSRRTFTEQEKLNMIHECEIDGVTFESVARKYNVKPNQLYVWRKELQQGGARIFSTHKSPLVIANEIRSMFDELKRIEAELSLLVGTKLGTELKSGKLSAYAASSAFSGYVSAVCRLQDQKLIALERLAECPEHREDEPFDLERDRAAEQLCLDLIAYKVEMDRKLNESERLQSGAS